MNISIGMALACHTAILHYKSPHKPQLDSAISHAQRPQTIYTGMEFVLRAVLLLWCQLPKGIPQEDIAYTHVTQPLICTGMALAEVHVPFHLSEVRQSARITANILAQVLNIFIGTAHVLAPVLFP